MKKLMILLMMLLLVSCTSQKTQTIDPNVWGYEFTMDEANGGFSNFFRSSTLAEEGIYFRMNVSYSGETQDDKAYLIGYLGNEDDQARIVNSNVNAECSLEKPQSCSSLIESNYQYLQHYNKKLYAVERDFDMDTNKETLKLLEMDLDGTNRKYPFEFAETPSMSGMSILFDKGKIYYSMGGSNTDINVIDMESWKEKTFKLEGQVDHIEINNIIDNKLLLGATAYSHDEKQYLNPLLYYDFNQETVDVEDVGLSLYQRREAVYVYYDETNESMNLYNADMDEHVKLKDGSGTTLLLDEYIVIFSLDTAESEIYLYDHSGNLLDEYMSDLGQTNTRAQVYRDGFIYAYFIDETQTETSFGRLSIKDGLIHDPEILITWSEH